MNVAARAVRYFGLWANQRHEGHPDRWANQRSRATTSYLARHTRRRYGFYLYISRSCDEIRTLDEPEIRKISGLLDEPKNAELV